MNRFYIYALIPPTPGGTNGARWNGWACPYFTREGADAIVAAWNEEYGTFLQANAELTALEETPCAWFDESTRRYSFYCPDSDALDSFDAETIDGREVWPIGAFCWTWEAEEDAAGGDMGFPKDREAKERAAVADTIAHESAARKMSWADVCEHVEHATGRPVTHETDAIRDLSLDECKRVLAHMKGES